MAILRTQDYTFSDSKQTDDVNCATPVTMENGIIWWQNWELLQLVVVTESKTAVVWFWHLIVATSRVCLAVRLEKGLRAV